MFAFKWSELTQIMQAQSFGSAPAEEISQIAVDSRKVEKGQLFFALKGEKVDGHQFVASAQAKGAVGAVVEKIPPEWPLDFPLLLVQDTLQALQNLAQANRQRAKIPVIAVTGSSGKTSTKDLLASILSVKQEVLKTHGNYNNELGLPLTLLELKPEHQFAVVEMGMRGLGEIDFLCRIACPTHGIITNIGKAHLELLGSQAKIAQAKCELLLHLSPEGAAVLPGDNADVQKYAQNFSGSKLFVGTDLIARNIRSEENGQRFEAVTPEGTAEIFLPVPGRHNVLNALSALGMALKLGISWQEIQLGLSNCSLSGKRLEIIQLKGLTLINDTYNANTDSMRAALQVLAEMGEKHQRTIAALGDMLELGECTQEEHQAIGRLVSELKINILLAVGELGRQIGQGVQGATEVYYFPDSQAAAEFAVGFCRAGDLLLAKASRAMQMEKIIEKFMNS